MTISDYIPEELFKIFQSCFAPRGLRAYLVGGALRDALRGEHSIDFDTEVYGVQFDELAELLSPFGKVHTVGRSFGVVKLTTDSGYLYDFSLPRIDSKSSPGHRGFQVQCDPSLSPKEAASRRDFTINAFMYDFGDQKILDFFGGESDLQKGILRHISDAFSEDPLRVLRGMQFASRFNLRAAPETIQLCQNICDTYQELSHERVAGEWMKWATLSQTPSLGILFLEQTGWIRHFPELACLRNCPQDPLWHTEGDVLTHTTLVCDAMVQQETWKRADKDTRATLLFAALCHDFGKPDTLSYEVIEQRERIRAKNHAIKGTPHVETFLQEVSLPLYLRKRIIPLCENHMTLFHGKPEELTSRALRRLAQRLEPETIPHLLALIASDRAGAHPADELLKKEPPFAESLLRIEERIQQLQLTQGAPRPILKGGLVIQQTGLAPGPIIKKIEMAAFEAQLDGEITDLPSAYTWLTHYLAKQ